MTDQILLIGAKRTYGIRCFEHRPLSDRLETAPLTAQRPQVSCGRCRSATATARIRESATRSQQLDWHNCIRHWIYCLYGPHVA